MQSPDCLFFWINMKRPACNTSHLVMACISTIFIYLSKIYISWKFAQSRDSEGLDNICSVFYSAHWPCKLQNDITWRGRNPVSASGRAWETRICKLLGNLAECVWGGGVFENKRPLRTIGSPREDGLEPFKLVLGSQTCQCSVVATRPTGSSMKSIAQHMWKTYDRSAPLEVPEGAVLDFSSHPCPGTLVPCASGMHAAGILRWRRCCRK